MNKKKMALLISMCLVLTSILPMTIVSAVTQATYYVSPAGSDSNPGTLALPFKSIGKARDVVRTINGNMTGDIIVYLRGGLYTLSQTLSFNELDSGTNGYNVIYKAYSDEEPIISGGQKVTGWTQVPGTNQWKASNININYIRELYVNGNRAQRARSSTTVSGTGWYDDPNYARSVQDGIYVDDSVIGYYANAGDVELHWMVDWKHMHHVVDRIISGGTGKKIIVMKQPYFEWGTKTWAPWLPTYDKPFYIENAYELLDTAGEWYYNRTTHEIFYWPLDGEVMSSAEVYAPVLETVMEVKGSTLTNKVHNMIFEGITFEHGTWLRPSVKGMHNWQADQIADGVYGLDPNPVTILVPGNITIDQAQDIWFQKNKVIQMGAAGLAMTNGARNINIIGNIFFDISDAAVIVGNYEHDYIGPGEEVCNSDIIKNNVIRKIGQEYWGAPAITAFYVDGINISHNDISDIPYSGISCGWGWAARTDSTTCKNNIIQYNRISDFMKQGRDGGAIYTLGQQPNSVCQYNYIFNQNNQCGGIYHDEGSAYYNTSNNVINVESAYYWMYMWTSSIHDIAVNNNYTSTSKYLNNGTNCPITNTTQVSNGNWPSTAYDIIKNSGVELAYRYLLASVEKMPVKNLKLWLKSDDGIVKDVNNYVSTWEDQSGNGKHAAQTISASKPLWVNNAVNGHPVIRCDGIDDYLSSSLTGLSTQYSIFFTLKPKRTVDYNQAICAANAWGEFVFQTNSTGGVYVGTSATSRIEPIDGPGAGTVAVDKWQQFTYTFNNGSAKFYKNGILLASKTISVGSNWSGFNIGLNTPTSTIDGDIAEVLVYDAALTDTDRKAVEGYLYNRYISVPSNGLKLWLKADSGITKDANNYVSDWKDQSSFDNNVTLYGTSTRPLWISGAVNGYPALRFDGVDDYLYLNSKLSVQGVNSFMEPEAYTVILAMKPSTTTNNNQMIGAKGGWGEFLFHTTSNGAVYVGPSATSRIEPNDGPRENTLIANSWQQYSFIFNNGSAKFYKSGAEFASKTLTVGNAFSGFKLGTPDSNTINGDIAEVLVYNNPLSDIDRQNVERYLREKYSMPATELDLCSDFSKTYSHTSSWQIDNSYLADFENDNGRFQRLTDTTQNIVYKYTNITGAKIRKYYWNTTEPTINFYVSNDGVSWQSVSATGDTAVLTQPGGSWYRRNWTVSSVPANMNYFKIEAPLNGYSFTPEIGRIDIEHK